LFCWTAQLAIRHPQLLLYIRTQRCTRKANDGDNRAENCVHNRAGIKSRVTEDEGSCTLINRRQTAMRTATIILRDEHKAILIKAFHSW
jgi:hypothetical protein